MRVAQYPGLVDLGDAVATRLFADETTADAATRLGLMRLFAIAERKELRSQVRWLPSLEQAKIKLTGKISAGEMEANLIDLLARIAFVENQPIVRTQTEFEARRKERGERISRATQEVATWLATLADGYFETRRQIESANKANHGVALADIKRQISWLMPEGFLSYTPWNWLKHYPRYLNAVAYRSGQTSQRSGKSRL